MQAKKFSCNRNRNSTTSGPGAIENRAQPVHRYQVKEIHGT